MAAIENSDDGEGLDGVEQTEPIVVTKIHDDMSKEYVVRLPDGRELGPYNHKCHAVTLKNGLKTQYNG